MPASLLPCREACRRAIEWFTAVWLSRRRDAEDVSPRGEFLVGHVPGRMRLVDLAPVKPFPLLGCWEFEVAHVHRRAAPLDTDHPHNADDRATLLPLCRTGYRPGVIDVSLTMRPDDDDPQLCLPFVSVQVNGVAVQALRDSGAARSQLDERPGMAMSPRAEDSTGALGVPLSAIGTAVVSMGLAGADIGTVSVAVVPAGLPGPASLIGQDVLGRFGCTYRLAEGILTLDPGPRARPTPSTWARSGTSTPMRHRRASMAWPVPCSTPVLSDCRGSTLCAAAPRPVQTSRDQHWHGRERAVGGDPHGDRAGPATSRGAVA